MHTSATDKAALFRSLHKAHTPLRLSNVWDVASARITESAGARAIAMTSAGVAWSLGVPDGSKLDRESAVAVIARIVEAVDLPVTADIEGGYSDRPEGVAATVAAVLKAGAVGINIEDGHSDPAQFVLKIAAARHAADSLGVELFINTRTDVFLAGNGSEAQQIDEAIERARLYVEAGADGIFVPGATSETAVSALVAGVAVPLNVMVGPGSIGVTELGRLGVARVSLGSGVAQSAYAVAQRAAEELLTVGTYESVAGGLDYGTLNDLFARAALR
ncbi:isocitrate lyase/PEP mutase family protein [Agreia bicolorata]|uniref:3-methyl-2-oxobutanoate hydroxymethyltransferase n=1 Tax=Agreia bicolorata TaxID=110935 RepID=A0ABR5CGU0_9MICO|nr:isocitrate lyase/phosphoenolpyruvate mutase family protein [Agreia bicolorata]KJC64860.1 3-methyl-2-oxobutanoate hydroxymethyltransferase [Agreia bicolorata]